MSPQWYTTGPLWRKTPVSRANLYISFRVPSKGARLQVPLAEPPQRDAPFPEPSFVGLSKSPINEPPSRFTTSMRHRHAFCKFKIYQTHHIHAKFKQLSCLVYRYNKVTMSPVPSYSTVGERKKKLRTFQETRLEEVMLFGYTSP